MSLISRFKSIGATKKNVLSNVGWATLGRIVRILTETLVSIFVARYLGPSDYGLMNYVVSFVAIFTTVSAFGLDNIEIREIAKPENDKNEILGTAFKLRLIFAFVAFLSIVVVLLFSGTDKYTALLILIYSTSVILSTSNLIRNYFTAIVNNKYIVITEILRCLIGALIKVGLLLIKAPLVFFIIALAFDFFLVAGGYLATYNKLVGSIKEWRFSKDKAKYLIRESFPLLLSGAAVIVYQRIDQVIIKGLLNNEAVGYFSVAAKFSEFILFVPLIMSQTISPLLVSFYSSDRETYRKKSQQFMDLTVWVSVFLSVLVSVISYPLIRYTFGTQYLAAVPVLQVLSFKAIGMALSNSCGQLIVIEGVQKWAVIRNLIGCVICVVSNYLLIPKYGVVGSAFATLVTVAFSGCIGNLFIPPYRHFFKQQISALFMGPVRILRLVINRQ